jgi:hypothetical protein
MALGVEFKSHLVAQEDQRGEGEVVEEGEGVGGGGGGGRRECTVPVC